MFEHLGARAKLLVLLALAFAFGLGLGRGMGGVRQGSGPELASRQPAVIQAVSPGPRSEPEDVPGLAGTFSEVAQGVTPAVVRIQTERRSGRRGPVRFRDLFREPPEEGDAPPLPQFAGGSGFLISPDGYILTNQHVIEGADRITVTLLDKRRFEARLVGRDRTTDVALVKIEAEGLPSLVLGDSDATRVGEWVLAVGNPGFGGGSTLDFTVTSGIISAKGRPLNIIGTELFAQQDPAAGFAIEDFIQTDAAINPGNSGGPLINLRGEVIGINTAILSRTGGYQGIGLSISSNLASYIAESLIETGRVVRGWLGIETVSVPRRRFSVMIAARVQTETRNRPAPILMRTSMTCAHIEYGFPARPSACRSGPDRPTATFSGSRNGSTVLDNGFAC
jgi:S1-C subfamily serine protease